MATKVTYDDLFENDEGELAPARERLHLWEQRLRLLLGMAVMWAILVPEVFDNAWDIAYAPLLWLALVAGPTLLGLYLLFSPSWRRLPIGARRFAIVRAFSIALIAFGSLALIFATDPTGESGLLLTLLVTGTAAFGLHRLNGRWQEPDAEELFP